MDEIDLTILKMVQRDARLTADSISREVGLSSPAVQKRLKRLRETGTIEREIAVVSPHRVGRNLTVIVDVSLERESRRHLDDFKRQMRKSECVQQCYYTTGDADFTLILVVKDIDEYEAFTQKHFFDAANITRFRTAVVMDRVKVSLDVL